MPDHVVGFDPVRVAALARAVAAAVADLRTVTSWEPAATAPLARVVQVCFDLDTTWLPTIAIVAGDTSMAGWDSAGPASAAPVSRSGSGRRGSATPLRAGPPSAAVIATIERFDELMARVGEGDLDALDELVVLLTEHAGEPTVMASLVDHLGAAGVLDTLLVVSAYGSRGAEAATLLVAAVDSAGVAGDPVFGAALGAVAADRMVAGPGAAALPDHASVYSVVRFLVGSDRTPVGFELAMAQGVAAHAAAGGSFVGRDGAPNELVGLADVDVATDPVAASLLLLAGRPADAAAFYGDAAVGHYVFVEHEFHDGYTALFESWAAACAGADLTDPAAAPSAARTHDANLIATQGVAWLAERAAAGRYAPDDASDRASVAAATVVTVHMVAVERTVMAPDGIHLGGAALTGAGPDLPTIQHDALGPGPVEIALLDSAGLGLLVGTAGVSDAGIAIVRAGSLTFQQHTATGVATVVAGELADGTPAVVVSDRFEQAVATAGHVEGYLLEAMWHQQQAAGRSQDQLVAFWIDGAEAVTGRLVAMTPGRLFTAAVPVLGGQLTARLATAEAVAVTGATAFADAQASHLSTTFTLALADAGVIAVPGSADGSPTAAEFAALTPAEQTEFWSAFEHGTAGSDLTFTLTTARDAIKLEQVDLYDALPR